MRGLVVGATGTLRRRLGRVDAFMRVRGQASDLRKRVRHTEAVEVRAVLEILGKEHFALGS